MKPWTVLQLLAFFSTAVSFRLPFFLRPAATWRPIRLDSETSSYCENFYKTACQKWNDENPKPPSEPVWNRYVAASHKISSRIENLLSESETSELKDAKLFYDSCVDEDDTMDEENGAVLRNLARNLGGSWFRDVLNHDDRVYDFMAHVIGVTKMFNVHPLLKFRVDLDYTNASNHILYIWPGDLSFPEVFLVEPKRYAREMDVYRLWMHRTLAYLYPELAANGYFDEDVEKLVVFESELAKLQHKTRGKNMRTVSVADGLPAGVNWKSNLRLLFDGVKTTKAAVNRVNIMSDYFTGLMKLVRVTDEDLISKYITWFFIKALSRDASKRLRYINFQVDRAILGVREDVSRRYECVQNVLSYFAEDLLPSYLKKHVDERSLQGVHEIAIELKKRFVYILKRNVWLSEDAKKAAMDKVIAVRFEIGYENVTESAMSIEEKGLTGSFLIDSIRLRRLKYLENLQQLSLTDTTQVKWPTNCFEVNAYYSVLQNAIVVPLGILEAPFFDVDAANVSNYGALGSLIGHELSHVLDGAGKSDGILLHETDQRTYAAKMDCFKTVYGNSYGVDGIATLGENVADVIGLRLSYGRRQFRRDRASSEKFFESFAQMWCESSTLDESSFFDEHSPSEVRVLATVANFEPFRKTYGCTNDIERRSCDLW